MLQRNGKVYTEIVPDYTKATLQAIIRGKADLESVVHSGGWRGYNGLIDLGYKKHFRAHHSNDEFARGKSHINGIESYGSFAKTKTAAVSWCPSSELLFASSGNRIQIQL